VVDADLARELPEWGIALEAADEIRHGFGIVWHGLRDRLLR
jgi:hypothetical protein